MRINKVLLKLVKSILPSHIFFYLFKVLDHKMGISPVWTFLLPVYDFRYSFFFSDGNWLPWRLANWCPAAFDLDFICKELTLKGSKWLCDDPLLWLSEWKRTHLHRALGQMDKKHTWSTASSIVARVQLETVSIKKYIIRVLHQFCWFNAAS